MAGLQTIIGLDVGTVRTGVAIGNTVARMARPLTTIDTNDFAAAFKALAEREQPDTIVVGLPRNLSGNSTQQTAFVEAFAQQYLAAYSIVWQDEALTSRQAEAELAGHGKPFTKGDIDALAASYILQDYLSSLPVSSEVAA